MLEIADSSDVMSGSGKSLDQTEGLDLGSAGQQTWYADKNFHKYFSPDPVVAVDLIRCSAGFVLEHEAEIEWCDNPVGGGKNYSFG